MMFKRKDVIRLCVPLYGEYTLLKVKSGRFEFVRLVENKNYVAEEKEVIDKFLYDANCSYSFKTMTP